MSAIVITGARGYIGAALARHFARKGKALRLVSRPSAGPPKEGMADEIVTTIEADLTDEAVWTRLMRDASTIIHLSARTDLRTAEGDPDGDERLNVEPVRALVRAAAKADAPPKIIFASTVTVFGPEHDNPANEQIPDQPCSVYDQHKVACEGILREATAARRISACTLRLSSVYGFGGTSVNSNRGILNVMMRRALAGETLTIYGNGAYIRDFIHLDDVVEAFALVVDAGPNVCDGSHYVIATGQGHSLVVAYELIADAAFAATGRRPPIKYVPEPPDLHPIERRNFIGDAALFGRRTGWRPQVSLAEGIGRFFAEELSHAAAAGRRVG